MVSKQIVETQYDIDVSSFQTSNNISKKNNTNKTNICTYANNNNSNKRYSNYKLRIKNNSFKKLALINDNSKTKYKNNLYLSCISLLIQLNLSKTIKVQQSVYSFLFHILYMLQSNQ